MGHRHTGRCGEKPVAGGCHAAQEIQGHSALHHAKLQDGGNTCKLDRSNFKTGRFQTKLQCSSCRTCTAAKQV